MQLIAYMAAHNGAEFIEYAIRSVIEHVDRFIVIEGAWITNFLVNKQLRSTDGTLKILEKLCQEYPHLEVYQHNEKTQLLQRNKVFDYIKSGWLWLIDHDEVYDEINITKIKSLCSTTDSECIKIMSLTFVNDFFHCVNIGWNRLFKIYPNRHYKFVAPNDIACNNVCLSITDKTKDIYYFHYSYCHDKERFMQKRRERILVHGAFKWKITDDGKVYAPNGTNIIKFDGQHPNIIREVIKINHDQNS